MCQYRNDNMQAEEKNVHLKIDLFEIYDDLITVTDKLAAIKEQLLQANSSFTRLTPTANKVRHNTPNNSLPNTNPILYSSINQMIIHSYKSLLS